MDGLNAAGFNPVSTCTAALPKFSPLGYLNLLCKCFRSPLCYVVTPGHKLFPNCKSGSCCWKILVVLIKTLLKGKHSIWRSSLCLRCAGAGRLSFTQVIFPLSFIYQFNMISVVFSGLFLELGLVAQWKRICLQCRRHMFNPWVSNILWRRK